MIRSQCTLDELQRWMLASIIQPAGDRPAAIEEFILPSRRQSAAERLSVYQHAYSARLLDVLRELFPCTRFAAGDDAFDTLAVGYLRRHPPHSYTLARLADRLVDYLHQTRPTDGEWGLLIVELARLEQAIDRIFDGPGPEHLPSFRPPDEGGGQLRLHFVPGFELHVFRNPVSTYYTDWKAGREPQWPRPRDQFVALLRRDYIVRRYELTRPQFELLSALFDGRTLEEALDVLAHTSPATTMDELAAQVREWFARWGAEQFFARNAAD
jgi:hypothetical protein